MGVGWGSNYDDAEAEGSKPLMGEKESERMQTEINKKKTLWDNARKTFGLEATPVRDASAEVGVLSSGAWSGG